VEIKSSATATPEMLGALKWWSKLAGASAGVATLVYAGSEALGLDGFSIRPWFAV